MSGYFKRLADHPGLAYAIVFTLGGAIAGYQRDGWRWAVIGGLAAGLVWIPVLLSNRR